MKTKSIFIFIMILALAFNLSAQEPKSVGSEMVNDLEFPEIKWEIPVLGQDVVVDTLENGMVLFMMPDHRLPVLNIRAMVRTGEIYEPRELMGLADMTGSVMRSGGTTNYEPDSLNAILEYLAASVETSIGLEQGNASLNCLSKDVESCLELFADVVMNPAFTQDKIDQYKERAKDNILRSNDNPNSIARREFYHFIYGDHPYGSIPDWEPIKKITREDLITYHKKYFVPNNIWLGITGDFEIEDIKARLTKVFEGFEPAEVDFPKIEMVDKDYHPGVNLIEKDVKQTTIYFGHLGITEDNPDRFAIALMNYILGGGSFTSRMTTIVRSDMGLAYSVRSSFRANSRDLGTFDAFCQTKNSSAYDAVYNMLDQIKKIRDEKVTPEELDGVKESYINSFVFQFTSPSQIVSRLMNLEYDGMPRDFYQKYIDNVKKVTLDDVQRVAKEYLHPDKMTYVLVGDTKIYADQMQEFGKINNVELEEPVVE